MTCDYLVVRYGSHLIKLLHICNIIQAGLRLRGDCCKESRQNSDSPLRLSLISCVVPVFIYLKDKHR